MNKTFKNPLGYEKEHKLLAKFAIPSVISMLVNALYNIVDQIFIGHGIGYLGNAATTVTLPLMTIFLAISTMTGGGASAYAAIRLGEKKEEEARYTLGNVFILLLAVGFIITIVSTLFLEEILNVFGATPQNIDYAMTYAGIIVFGCAFNMLGVGLSNMARCDGSPKVAMYSMVSGAVFNTILDPIFIYIFKWGVAGAAIATVLSQILSASILIYYFIYCGNMRLEVKYLKLSIKRCFKVFSLGVSSCITQSAAALMQIVMNNSLVHYGNLITDGSIDGDIALSAMGIVMKVSTIIVSIGVGIGVGAQPILGFNKGARQPKRIKKTYQMAATAASVVAICGWLACQLVPQYILALFGNDNGAFQSFAISCMRIYMGGIFCAGFQITATSYFQATGQPLKASILSMLRQLILLIPLIIVLPMIFGLEGILYAGPTADIGSGLIVAFFISKEMKRLNQWIKEDSLCQS